MIIKLHCDCGQPIEVEAEQHGQSFNCPSCNKDLIVPDYKPSPPVIPPPIPVTERVKIKEKQSHAGPIALFLIGLILTPFTCGIGILFIVVAIIADLLTPIYKSIYVCGQCGNSISSVSKICPVCHIELIDPRPWWKF
jgi:DNA-directed RNA polymerase subunit RPC12/RpoP